MVNFRICGGLMLVLQKSYADINERYRIWLDCIHHFAGNCSKFSEQVSCRTLCAEVHLEHGQTSMELFNLLRANPIKWSNPLKQFVVKLPTNCLSVLDHFMKLALKGLRK